LKISNSHYPMQTLQRGHAGPRLQVFLSPCGRTSFFIRTCAPLDPKYKGMNLVFWACTVSSLVSNSSDGRTVRTSAAFSSRIGLPKIALSSPFHDTKRPMRSAAARIQNITPNKESELPLARARGACLIATISLLTSRQ
jgi:hypothetical protein